MVGRYEISDGGWALIEDIVSPPQTMGRPKRDDKKMLNGIFWVLCSGPKWRDLPERYGPWSIGGRVNEINRPLMVDLQLPEGLRPQNESQPDQPTTKALLQRISGRPRLLADHYTPAVIGGRLPLSFDIYSKTV